MKRLVSIPNPPQGCNSDLAQYSDTSPTQPPVFEHEDEHEHDFEAPYGGSRAQY